MGAGNAGHIRVCFGVVAAWVLGSVCLFADATVETPEESFDFGALSDTETVKHTFVLLNRGDESLKIERIRTCCGLKASASAHDIEPAYYGNFDVVCD